MPTREEVITNAIADAIRDRLATFQPAAHRIEIPPPQVVNNLPETVVTVHVDMTPVAEAVDRMTDAFTGLTEMMSKLVQVLASQPPPTVDVKPEITVQPAKVEPSKVVFPPRVFPILRLEVGADGNKRIVPEVA